MPKLIDLAGRRVGSLVIQARAPKRPGDRFARWVTVCDCGQERVYRMTELVRADPVRSCGCQASRMINLKGMRFGMLLAIERAPRDPQKQGTRWVCRCDCGRISVARTKDLRYEENTTSCGCRINRIEVTRGGQVTARQRKLLEAVDEAGGSRRQHGLEHVIGVDVSTLSHNVGRLVRGGYLAKALRRSRWWSGARVVLTLTDAGRTLLAGEAAPAAVPAMAVEEHQAAA